MAGITQLPTVEFKEKKRKKGFKEKKRSKKSAQYDSGSEDEREGRTKLQKLHLADKDSKDGTDEKMSEVYEGANFEKELSSDDESPQVSEEEADDEAEVPTASSVKTDKTGKLQTTPKGAGDQKTKEAAFAAAMSQILNAEVDEKTPVILSKNKILTKIIDKEKEKEQERKSLKMQKKIIRDQYHLKPNIATNKDNETKLRKIATKGVVQLFTAVSVAQTTAEKNKSLKEKKTITVGGQKKQVSELESAAFVDLLKTTGKQGGEGSGTTSQSKTKVSQTKNAPRKPTIKKEIKVEKEEEYEDE